jgi:hypothetical protein
VALANPTNLEELNRYFRIWLSEGYHHKPHSGLSGRTPAQVFAEDKKPVKFVSPEVLRDAFLWEKSVSVDKAGCAKLDGQMFEAGMAFCRKKVLLRYDPFDLSQVEVWHDGKKQAIARLLNPGEYNGQVKTPPETLEKATHSRTLELLAKKETKRLRKHTAFRLSEGVNQDV